MRMFILAFATLVASAGAAHAEPISALILGTIGITSATTIGQIAITITALALSTAVATPLTYGGGNVKGRKL